MTPLFIASFNGHVEAVKALLGLGAAVNQATVGCWDLCLAWLWVRLWFVRVGVGFRRLCAREWSGVCCIAPSEAGGTRMCSLNSGCMGVHVESAEMMGRMRRAMMSGGSWVGRGLDVLFVRTADVCDCVDRRMV